MPIGLAGQASRAWHMRKTSGGSNVMTVTGTTLRTSALINGWVHTQHDPGTSLSSGRQTILANSAIVQGQHLQGFGAGAVWPTQAGAKDWSDLDRIFGYPTATTGYMKDATYRVLYALSCPAWMRVPESGSWNMPYAQGSTTNEYDYTPPHSSHFDEFAGLVAAAVTRYPHLTHVAVWNEGKGFWGPGLTKDYGTGTGRWDYEDYTTMYNAIYTAVKTARSSCKVGGPYWVANTQGWEYPNDWADDAESDTLIRLQGHSPAAWGYADKKFMYVVRYWLQNATGADFLALDLRNSTKDFAAVDAENVTYAGTVVTYPGGGATTATRWDTNPQSGAQPYYWPATPFDAWQKQDDILAWIRLLGNTIPASYGRSGIDARTLPVWYMEWYPNSTVNSVIVNPNTGSNYANSQSTHAEKAAVAAEGLRRAAVGGTAGVLQWRVEGDASGNGNPLALWNSSGTATEVAAVHQYFKENFAEGTTLLQITNVPDWCGAIATATKLLLINRTNSSQSVYVDGATQTLSAYEVKLVTRP